MILKYENKEKYKMQKLTDVPSPPPKKKLFDFLTCQNKARHNFDFVILNLFWVFLGIFQALEYNILSFSLRKVKWIKWRFIKWPQLSSSAWTTKLNSIWIKFQFCRTICKNKITVLFTQPFVCHHYQITI